LNKKDKKTPLHTLDMKGNCRREWSVSVWRKSESLSDQGCKAPAYFAGVSQPTAWGWWYNSVKLVRSQ